MSYAWHDCGKAMSGRLRSRPACSSGRSSTLRRPVQCLLLPRLPGAQHPPRPWHPSARIRHCASSGGTQQSPGSANPEPSKLQEPTSAAAETPGSPPAPSSQQQLDLGGTTTSAAAVGDTPTEAPPAAQGAAGSTGAAAAAADSTSTSKAASPEAAATEPTAAQPPAAPPAPATELPAAEPPPPATQPATAEPAAAAATAAATAEAFAAAAAAAAAAGSAAGSTAPAQDASQPVGSSDAASVAPAGEGAAAAPTTATATQPLDQPVSKWFALAVAPGTLFMLLSVLPPVLFMLHRLFVTLLQLTVFVIVQVIFADRSVPPLTWREFCQGCLETSTLMDELVPVLLLVLAGLQQGFMDACSGLFRLLLLAPALIPATVALVAWAKSEAAQQLLQGLAGRLPQSLAARLAAVGEKIGGWWRLAVGKVPDVWRERVRGVGRALQTPAAQQLLLQSSILLTTGWLASVFTEPLRPGSSMATVSLIAFFLLRIATFVVDVAVLRQLWRGMRAVMQGNGSLSYWVGSNQQVVLLAVARAGLEVAWALSIGLRFMFGITTGWKVLVVLYLLYYATTAWKLSQQQAEEWPRGAWTLLALHALVAMIVSWPLCLPGWEALPELGIIHKGNDGFWGSL